MSRMIDLTGQTYGTLIVVAYQGKGMWLCRCSCCGVSKLVSGANLRGKIVISCGKISCRKQVKPEENLVGQYFGDLLVAGYRGDKNWECVCKCGTTITVKQHLLLKKQKTSCDSCAFFKRYGSYPKLQRHANSIYEQKYGKIPEGFVLTSLDGTAFKQGGNRNLDNLILVDKQLSRKLYYQSMNFKDNPQAKLTAIMSLALEYMTQDAIAGKKPRQYYIQL